MKKVFLTLGPGGLKVEYRFRSILDVKRSNEDIKLVSPILVYIMRTFGRIVIFLLFTRSLFVFLITFVVRLLVGTL